MKLASEGINRDLLALTESFAEGAIGPAEFRRSRRELVCAWTGEAVPEIDQGLPAEDDTQPALKPVTDKDIEAAQSAPQHESTQSAHAKPAAHRSHLGWWVTGLLLIVAAGGAVALAWFILRRSV